ncbi:MAG TPA: hypothetical protein H9746_06995 [Candidatus Butyricicoccus avistercoris]|uniref:HlyD family efflux transporter periplasmic adaptor subunit n=1 Tax=Candidatus Butyricicoccus avistercoris TaxID=2838518 RepID=A0A9D1PI86_9FIRM|nr:hypothetical protein [Candidatus Butyricicoccus avistercoris]
MKEKNKFNFHRLGIILFMIIMLSIVLWQIMVNKTETQTAVKVTVNDSFMSNGWFFRNEVMVQGTTGDTVKHIVQGGEKVQKNAALAVVYTNASALENSQKISVLDDQIELLESAAQMITNGSDSVKIESMITNKIAELSSEMQQSSVSGMESSVTELRNLCLRRAIDSVDKETLLEQAQSLTSERNYLQQQIGNSSITIASPASGFFSEVVDGFESKLTISSLDTMTASELENLDPSKITTTSSDTLGKVVQDFRWYFAMFVPKENVEDLSVGDSLLLRFAQVSSDIQVSVNDIRKQKNDENALLIVSGMEITPEILSMRYQSVEVIKEIYTGIQVPKNAVRIQTDSEGNSIQGVFILPDSISRFKPIEVLYETGNYYIVKQGTTTQNTGLVVGDRIIVKGRDLEDLKVVK